MPMSVKAGDRVLLPGWGGNAIKVGEEVRWVFSLSYFPWLIGVFFFLL